MGNLVVGGGFGFRWGMGPGDVRDRLPHPDQFIVVPDTVGEADRGTFEGGSYEDKVEDLNVTVFVGFRRGRLFRVEIATFVVRDLLAPSSTPEEFMRRADAHHESEMQWVRALLTILVQKYGTPVRSPSDKVLQCLDSKVTCPWSVLEHEPAEYVWESSGSEVTLNARTPRLIYVDTTVKAEYEAAKAHLDADAAAEKRRRREKL